MRLMMSDMKLLIRSVFPLYRSTANAETEPSSLIIREILFQGARILSLLIFHFILCSLVLL